MDAQTTWRFRDASSDRYPEKSLVQHGLVGKKANFVTSRKLLLRRNMNYPMRAGFFSFFLFFGSHNRWSRFWLRETWRSVFKFNSLENYHDFSIREEKHNFLSSTCNAIVKKKKWKTKRLSIARTMIDHDRYRLLSAEFSAENSGNCLLCISTSFFKGEVRTINDRNICERRSCMKNNGKSPIFKFVSGEERRPSEVQLVSRGWRLPGAMHSSADPTWKMTGN